MVEDAVCNNMKSGRQRLGILLLALFLAACFPAACENPFDPLDTSDEIRGLSYIDFSLTWDRWDSDPEGDGVVVSIEYFNEFGDSLAFNDKPHRVIIEFYTQQTVNVVVDPDTGAESGGSPTFETLFFTFPVEQENSDDDIRIPIEAYRDAMVGAGLSVEDSVSVFVNIRVLPPKQMPQPELVAFFADQTIFVPEPTAATEEELVGNGEP